MPAGQPISGAPSGGLICIHFMAPLMIRPAAGSSVKIQPITIIHVGVDAGLGGSEDMQGSSIVIECLPTSRQRKRADRYENMPRRKSRQRASRLAPCSVESTNYSTSRQPG